MRRKIYKIEFKGVYLGCIAIVRAFNIIDAHAIVKNKYNKDNPDDYEQHLIEEIQIDKDIIHYDSGDY